jgi:hypothetical protein
MIPITAAVVGGHSVADPSRAGSASAPPATRARAVALTSAYVLGLSLAYATLGLVAGLITPLRAVVVAAILASIPAQRSQAQGRGAGETSPCAADPNYQRLAFWVGEWEVLDSTGARYATQRVHTAVDACAITVEWTGRVGDKGLGLSAFDGRTGEWRQVYVSNQIPSPSGVQLRKSDPTYSGPGVRFIPLLDPAGSTLARSRVTVMPSGDRHVLQLFEDSSDGGKTWHTLFKADHRPLQNAQP